jgi:hypothetical protein
VGLLTQELLDQPEERAQEGWVREEFEEVGEEGDKCHGRMLSENLPSFSKNYSFWG